MLELIVSNRTEIRPLDRVPALVLSILKDRLSLDNPEFLERRLRGRSTHEVPRKLVYFQADHDVLAFPRGCTSPIIGTLKKYRIPFRRFDRRRLLPNVDFTFSGRLRDYQERAVDAVLSRWFGTLSAPTGSGKTVIALACIARRQQPALVVVHTRELLDQWIERIETFLGIPAGEVGVIGGGKQRIGEKITVALVQSLYKCAGKVSPHVGYLVVDECHRTPSRTFTEAVTAFDSYFMLGLTATPWRRDGLTRLIHIHLGGVVHEIDKQTLVAQGSVLQAEIITRETMFLPDADPSTQYPRALAELTRDPARNRLIASDVAAEVHNGGGVCLVLTDRKNHCVALRSILESKGISAAVLTGDVPQRERRRIVEDMNAGRVRVVIATGQLVGEGFDCRALSTLFLATPVRFSGRLVQYLGRVLRPAPGKAKARIFDYVDARCGVFRHAARQRKDIYAAAG